MSETDTRAELFTALQGLAGIMPEMRCGQLMSAVGELCTDIDGRGLWDASDAELLEAIWHFRRNFENAKAPQGRSGAESALAQQPLMDITRPISSRRTCRPQEKRDGLGWKSTLNFRPTAFVHGLDTV